VYLLGSYPLWTADEQDWEESKGYGVKSLLASEDLVRMSSIQSKGNTRNLLLESRIPPDFFVHAIVYPLDVQS